MFGCGDFVNVFSELWCRRANGYLCEVERGNANISINNLSKISIALNIPLTNLIDINHEQNKEILIDELHKIINSANIKQLKLIYKIINDIIY